MITLIQRDITDAVGFMVKKMLMQEMDGNSIKAQAMDIQNVDYGRITPFCRTAALKESNY